MILDDIPLRENFLGVRTIQTPDGTLVGPVSGPVVVAGKMEITDEPDTGKSMKVMLRDTDTPYGGGIRGELTLDYEPFEVERWYTFEVFIPENFQEGSIFSLMQMHDEPDNGDSARSPNFLFSTDGRYIFAETGEDIPNQIAQRRKLGTASLVKGRWVQCCLHVWWSKSTTNKRGFMEFSYDGKMVGKDYLRPTAYDDVLGAYVKFGLYDIAHNPTFGNRSAYFRNLKRYDGDESWVTTLRNIPGPRLGATA